MPKQPDVPALTRMKDLEGLKRALRFAGSAEIRQQAAVNLMIFPGTDAAEHLIRSTLEDPDRGVRQAARQALDFLLGKETARNALEAFREGEGEDEPWLLDEWEDEEKEDGGSREWSTADIRGLVAVLVNERHTGTRLKAIRVLKDIHNTQALEALAHAALWDEDEMVKLAAREALEGVYGDRLAEALEYFQNPDQEDEAGDDDLEDDYLEAPAGPAFPADRPLHQEQIQFSTPPAMQEDNPLKRFLLIFFVILVLAALVYFFVLPAWF